MRVRMIIATEDKAYSSHISEYISQRYADIMEIGVCNEQASLTNALEARKYDIALVDEALALETGLNAVALKLLLWTGAELSEAAAQMRRVKKHQRVSKTISAILEQYAAVTGSPSVSCDKAGSIAAVWSPSGGVGKSTVALAYAYSMAQSGKDVFYLSLETFSAATVYFGGRSRSISAVFEMLEGGGNINMLISGISSQEGGIRHLGAPDNFDDICVLSPENINELVTRCAELTYCLVVDLPSACDPSVRQVFELAGKVLLVTNCTDTAQAKLELFVSQGGVYEGIRGKITPVINKTAHAAQTNANPNSDAAQTIADALGVEPIHLPYIPTTDAQRIYKTLAKEFATI